MTKPKIFISTTYFLPGYRAGGPVQSIKNIIDSLSNDFDFYIFTSDHDFGVKEQYEDVFSNKWNDVYNAKVFYSSKEKKRKNLFNILKKEKFSLIFLNSFFSTDSISVLIYYKLLRLKTPVALMPRGELSEGALNLKRTKKITFINLIQKTNLLNDINYLATANDEYEQIIKLLKTEKVSLVSNIPNTGKKILLKDKKKNSLRIVFLSRITRKKNLHYALETLAKCKRNINMDIYGTLEDLEYWEECKKLIKEMPINIDVNYKEGITNTEVISTLSEYDLFFFPTLSENYGHVISEAFQSSIPVLISDNTPWVDLENKSLGWVYSLNEQSKFTNKIDQLAEKSAEEYNIIKKNIYENYDVEKRAKEVTKQYNNLLKELIAYEK